MKKLISLLAACSVALAGFSAFAATDREIFDVTSLGIMQGDETGDLKLEKKITRAEFSQIILNLIDVPLLGIGTMPGRFADVSEGAWYAPAVNYIAALGYISGEPDGTFRPEDNVLIQEAYKILVHVLGYEVAAQEYGAYPGGYVTEAAKLKLNTGITKGAAEEALRGDVLTMVYNALDIELLQKQFTDSDDPAYEVVKGETLRKRFGDSSSIYQTRGVVTADNSTWLISPNAGIEPGDVEVDGLLYHSSGIDTAPYVGQEVEIYYTEDRNNGRRTIKTIAPTSENTVLEFDQDQFSEYSSGVLSYFAQEDAAKASRANLAEDCVLLYNNRVLTRFTAEDMRIQNGTYRLIDHDGDRKYDYIFLWEEENVLAESVFETGEIYFKNTFTVNGQRYLTLDPAEPQEYRIQDQDGQTLKITDIQKGDVLTVMQSKGGEYTRIVTCRDRAEGTVNEIREDEVLIGETWTEPVGSNLELNLGAAVSGYLNYRGQLVYLEEGELSASGAQYGYIAAVSAAEPGSLNSTRVRLIQAGQVASREEENKENLDDKNKIPVLYCQNEGLAEMELTSKIRIDGVSFNTEEYAAKHSLVGPWKYTLDAAGRIRSLESLERIGGMPGKELQYSAKEKVFADSMYGGFAIDEETRVLCVPENPAAADENYLVEVKIDNRDATQKFDAQGYDLNEISKSAKLLVVTRPMDADTVVSTNYSKSGIGIVVSAARGLDEKLDEVYQITILSKDGEKEYATLPLNANNEGISGLQAGDAVLYELDSRENLQNASVIVNARNLPEPREFKPESENGYFCGRVKELELNVVDVEKVRKVDDLVIQTDKISEVRVPTRNAPVVFLYEEKFDRYSVTSTENIREGVDDVYIFAPYGAPKMLLIKR